MIGISAKNQYEMQFKVGIILNTAVRKGIIKKPTSCSKCGTKRESKFIHGHHWNYFRPLDVVWLCATCHVKLHNRLAANGKGPPRIYEPFNPFPNKPWPKQLYLPFL